MEPQLGDGAVDHHGVVAHHRLHQLQALGIDAALLLLFLLLLPPGLLVLFLALPGRLLLLLALLLLGLLLLGLLAQMQPRLVLQQLHLLGARLHQQDVPLPEGAEEGVAGALLLVAHHGQHRHGLLQRLLQLAQGQAIGLRRLPDAQLHQIVGGIEHRLGGGLAGPLRGQAPAQQHDEGEAHQGHHHTHRREGEHAEALAGDRPAIAGDDDIGRGADQGGEPPSREPKASGISRIDGEASCSRASRMATRSSSARAPTLFMIPESTTTVPTSPSSCRKSRSPTLSTCSAMTSTTPERSKPRLSTSTAATVITAGWPKPMKAASPCTRPSTTEPSRAASATRS